MEKIRQLGGCFMKFIISFICLLNVITNSFVVILTLFSLLPPPTIGDTSSVVEK